jgi:hypothetical protein
MAISRYRAMTSIFSNFSQPSKRHAEGVVDQWETKPNVGSSKGMLRCPSGNLEYELLMMGNKR